MSIFFLLLAYAIYAVFWGRIIFHAVSWYKASIRQKSGPVLSRHAPLRVCAGTVIDVLFFRRLLAVNGALWLGSWFFHISFLIVILHHLRYFLEPVPECIASLQTVGTVAGYALPLSLLLIAVVRTSGREHYTSRTNVFLLILLFLIGATGLLMRVMFRPDLVEVKYFILGMLTFTPEPLPGNILFLFHFLLVLILVPFLPTHILAAPFVLREARIREEELRMVMHEK